ncbi:hypothetical protein GALL_207200 [mine drainage metagenome]|uniref:Uncharacterized protein n=1 Tax=mine drainage metagenome TaxID=410659 RepID=A0A1J5RZI4_9ZZZZ
MSGGNQTTKPGGAGIAAKANLGTKLSAHSARPQPQCVSTIESRMQGYIG